MKAYNQNNKMAKKKFKIFLTLIAALTAFLAITGKVEAQCDKTLNTFSDGATSKTTILPAGGGTVEIAKIKLPMGTDSQVCSAEMKIDKTGETGTPYIWIPNSGSNTLAQIRTSDGTLVKLYQNSVDGFPGTAFSNNSRITLVPGGDVWNANRGNGTVVRLTPKPAPSEEYEYGGFVSLGLDCVRAVTFDRNGYLWAGTCGGVGCAGSSNNRIRVFCGSTVTSDCSGKTVGYQLAEFNTGATCNYGMIGDKYGFVWSVGGGVLKSYSYSGGTISEVANSSDSVNVGGSYGIGIDSKDDIWVGKWAAPMGTYKVSRDANGNITSVASFSSGLSANSGIAVDGTTPLGNVWVAGYNTNKVSRFRTDGTFVANYDVGSTPHGVAIDSDNNAWLVNLGGGAPPGQVVLNPSGCVAGAGSVSKFNSNGNYIATYTTCGNGPYNYSDMTGFRTPRITVKIAGLSIPITTHPFTINDTTVPGFSNALTNAFQTCACNGCKILNEDVCGNPVCEVSITISSVFTGGSYTLSGLKVNYEEPLSQITGGLVPCGRNCDDTSTLIREDAPCTLCATFVLSKRVVDFTFTYIVIPLAILMFVIAGILFLFAAEDIQRIKQAKTLSTMAAIGLVVIFSAWLLVNLVVFFATEEKAPLPGEMSKVFGKPWNEISCPFCGDGICNSSRGENNTTCRYDCP